MLNIKMKLILKNVFNIHNMNIIGLILEQNLNN